MTVFKGTITGTGHVTDLIGDSADITFSLVENITATVGIDGSLTGSLSVNGSISVTAHYAYGGTYSDSVPLSLNAPVVTNIHNFQENLNTGAAALGVAGIVLTGSIDAGNTAIALSANAAIGAPSGFFGNIALGGALVASGGTLGLTTALLSATRPTSGTIPYSFTVTRAGDISAPDTAAWSVIGAGSVPASVWDFPGHVLPSGTVSFAAGQSTAVVGVNVAGQSAVAPTSSFALTLSSPSIGAKLSAALANATIASALNLAPGQVKIAGVGADLATLQFADTVSAAAALAAAATINLNVLHGLALPFSFTQGASIPTLAGGLSGALVMHGGGTISLPLGYTALSIDAALPVTAIGGPLDGQVILAGTGDLAFNAGLGAGSVIAAGGANLVSMYPGAGKQFVQLGGGNDTVVALAGDDTVSAGTGANMILLGAGNLIVNSTGADLISAAAAGHVTINAGANNPVAFFGAAQTVFNGGSGHATLVAGSGAVTINAVSGSQLWLGGGSASLNSFGTDTVIGGSGDATVQSNGPGDFIFAGAGALDFTLGLGSTTILGSSGAETLHGGSGSMIVLSYGATRYFGGGGADTVAGFGGSLTVTGGAGSGVFLGAAAGGNVLTGGSGVSILIGGGNGDVLTAGSGPGDVLKAGPGAETLTGAGTTGAHKFYAGSGADLMVAGSGNTQFLDGTGSATMVAGTGLDLFAFANGNAGQVTIQGFNPALDYLSLPGFPTGERDAALGTATVVGGSERLTLSDGTHVTFLAFTGLQATNFL